MSCCGSDGSRVSCVDDYCDWLGHLLCCSSTSDIDPEDDYHVGLAAGCLLFVGYNTVIAVIVMISSCYNFGLKDSSKRHRKSTKGYRDC